ncbi:hypothetical protein QQ25_02665 [Mycolicibacterium setense]|nr:hypothetical protein QQ25_02665 [Mycolicibacterium setense]
MNPDNVCDAPIVTVRQVTVASSDGRLLAGPAEFDLAAATVTALVAPSGGGKSLVSRCLVGDLPAGVSMSGSATVAGAEVSTLDRRALRRLRRSQIAFVGQDPGSQLNPAATVERLLTELAHPDAPTVPELLELLELDPALARRRAAGLSGGQQRRVALARALSRMTPVLVVDEPLAGLHQELRAVIAHTLRRVAGDHRVAVMVTAHTAEAAALFTDRIVELPVDAPVTGVEGSSPAQRNNGGATALQAEGLRVTLGGTQILNGIDLSCRSGSAVGLMGDSGSGKTTLARALTGQVVADAGVVRLNDQPVSQPLRKRSRNDRLAIQLIPQNPLATLNPRRTVGATLRRPLAIRGGVPDLDRSVAELLSRVGLPAEFAGRHPHMLSGGQRQRVAIARALAYSPKVLVCDEITSALDPVASALVMDVLHREMVERDLAVLLITHDGALAREHCQNVVHLVDGSLVTAPLDNNPTTPRAT